MPVLHLTIQSSITLLQIVIVLFYFHIARSFGLVLRKTGGVHDKCHLFGEISKDWSRYRYQRSKRQAAAVNRFPLEEFPKYEKLAFQRG